jgi:hypothetical protein
LKGSNIVQTLFEREGEATLSKAPEITPASLYSLFSSGGKEARRE